MTDNKSNKPKKNKLLLQSSNDLSFILYKSALNEYHDRIWNSILNKKIEGYILLIEKAESEPPELLFFKHQDVADEKFFYVFLSKKDIQDLLSVYYYLFEEEEKYSMDSLIVQPIKICDLITFLSESYKDAPKTISLKNNKKRAVSFLNSDHKKIKIVDSDDDDAFVKCILYLKDQSIPDGFGDIWNEIKH